MPRERTKVRILPWLLGRGEVNRGLLTRLEDAGVDEHVRRLGDVMAIHAIWQRYHQGGSRADPLLRPGLHEHPVMRHDVRILEGERDGPAGLGLEFLLQVIQRTAGLDLQDDGVRPTDFGLPTHGTSLARLGDGRRMDMRRLLGDGPIPGEVFIGFAQSMRGKEDLRVLSEPDMHLTRRQ